MKKRTSNVSRRIVSLLMSMVLTLVTPAAFATEVVGGSGTAIVEGDTNPADANPSGDNEGKDDENKDTEHGGDEQPTNPGDEDKNPGEGEDDVNASSNEADTQEGEGTDTPVVAQRTVTLEKWNKNAAYDVKIVIPAATSEPGEGETTEAPGEGENAGSGNETLSTEYTGTDEKITLKLTTEDYTDNPIIYIKSSADEVVAETTPKLGDDGTLEYVFTGEETDITLYYGTKDDFVSAWYGDGSATKATRSGGASPRGRWIRSSARMIFPARPSRWVRILCWTAATGRPSAQRTTRSRGHSTAETVVPTTPFPA